MSNQRSMTDKVRLFAERISESGPSALSGLFDLTAQRLIRFATTITRNQHDAEDVVQDVLVRVAGRPELLCAANKPWHYLLQMVRNESLRVLRRQKKWNLVDQIGQVLARPCPDHLEQYDRNQAVLAALQSIPSEQGEVVALKIWEEMTFAEIGDVLQVSPATAASRYRYAIEKLTKTFGTQQAGGRRMNSEADVEQLIREVGDCVQPSSEMRPETMQRARELSDELHARGLLKRMVFVVATLLIFAAPVGQRVSQLPVPSGVKATEIQSLALQKMDQAESYEWSIVDSFQQARSIEAPNVRYHSGQK